MIQRERYFQYLVALAVAGQISDTELKELMDHTARCSNCSQRMAEMESTNFLLFVTLADQIRKQRIPLGMQERFLIRAAHSGVPMSASSSGFQHSNFLQLAALFVAVCLFCGLGWRQITQSSLRPTLDSTTRVRIPAPAQLSATADPGLGPLASPVAGRSVNGLTRRNHAPSRASNLRSFAVSEDSRVAARPTFRLEPASFLSPPKAINNEAKLRSLTDVPVGYFSAREVGLKPGFSTPVSWSADESGGPDKRVFHYSATVASVSLQDDRAVFGLKPRVRDLSFRDTVDSTRSR